MPGEAGRGRESGFGVGLCALGQGYLEVRSCPIAPQEWLGCLLPGSSPWPERGAAARASPCLVLSGCAGDFRKGP